MGERFKSPATKDDERKVTYLRELISDYSHKTKAQISTYELKIPASDIKPKLSSNPIYQGSASEMILIQFSHP